MKDIEPMYTLCHQPQPFVVVQCACFCVASWGLSVQFVQLKIHHHNALCSVINLGGALNRFVLVALYSEYVVRFCWGLRMQVLSIHTQPFCRRQADAGTIVNTCV